jgi:uncharacterized Zn-finger protein
MSQKKPKKSTLNKEFYVRHADLPLSCPTPKMDLWNSHPKVYLPIEKTGVEVCPYCGNRYVLQDE